MIPFCRSTLAHGVAGPIKFLVHLPKAKKKEEEAKMQWGIARGSVRYRTEENATWVDARTVEDFEKAQRQGYPFEAVEETIRQEAGEELGLAITDDMPLIDLGTHRYVSLNHPPYPIQFFAVEVPPEIALHGAKDAQRVAFKSLDEIREMVNLLESAPPNERMKPGYLSILEAVEKQLLT